MAITIFTPGRTELAGNHTEHQDGRVLASAVDVGLTATVEKTDGKNVHIESEGFPAFDVALDELEVLPTEFGTSRSLVRGMLADFRDLGLKIGPFSAHMTSTLPSGSGLSSSAAFSVMIGRILNELYNGQEASPVVIARSAQKAENDYFGKPCGLMDQLACSLGHAVYVDFKTMEIDPIIADFGAMGLTLCLTNTGGSHAGLDSSYARIRSVMRKATEMGLEIPESLPAGVELSEKEENLIQMLATFPAIVKQAGDEYSPSAIANYTYDLVKEFNQFYHDFSILHEEQPDVRMFRLVLASNVAKVVKLAMGLLGIEVPERM